MKKLNYTPDILDFAYQIIELHRENDYLRGEVEHYKELHEMNSKALKDSIESTKESIGMMVGEIINPDSFINKAGRALLKEEIEKQEVV